CARDAGRTSCDAPGGTHAGGRRREIAFAPTGPGAGARARRARADPRQLSERGLARGAPVLRASAQPLLADPRRRAGRAARRAAPRRPPRGRCLAEPLAALPYADRLSRVRRHRLAIWDTIVACERAGSLDSAIRNAERGEIARVRRVARGLVAVCFNGNTAARAQPAWAAAGYATLVLPSTSPAYTRPIAAMLFAWRELRRFLEDDCKRRSS